MIQFGSTGIVAGYIKQLLATFPLPKTQIYTAEHERYFDEHGIESPYLLETTFPGQTVTSTSDVLLDNNGHLIEKHCYVPYIKDGRIQFLVGGYYLENNKYVQGNWQSAPLSVNNGRGGAWHTYSRGSTLNNLTKTLEIKNNIYDSYTHEYLGDYLRFLRDYDGINLMSMYNCFSNRRPYRLKYADEFISMDTSDPNYKLYVLPVKLFQEYTIAIDSAYPVELCCGVNTKINSINVMDVKNDSTLEQDLSEATYQKYASLRFNDPILYTKLKELAVEQFGTVVTSDQQKLHEKKRKLLAELGAQVHELNLYIKLHKNAETSIVILEGNYLGWNDTAVTRETITLKPQDASNTSSTRTITKIDIKSNHVTIPNAAIFADFEPTYIGPVSLLRFNTKSHTPFAPRLLEYLLDQCVTGGANEVRENVLMAQYVAGLRHKGHYSSTKMWAPPKLSKGQKTVNDKTLYWILGNIRTNVEVDGNNLPEFSYVTVKDAESGEQKIMWYLTEDPDHKAEAVKVTIAPDALNYDLLNGVWTPALRKIFYSDMSTRADFGSYSDILGYVDKEVEKKFIAAYEKDNKFVRKSMIDFNAWEDIKE